MRSAACQGKAPCPVLLADRSPDQSRAEEPGGSCHKEGIGYALGPGRLEECGRSRWRQPGLDSHRSRSTSFQVDVLCGSCVPRGGRGPTTSGSTPQTRLLPRRDKAAGAAPGPAPHRRLSACCASLPVTWGSVNQLRGQAGPSAPCEPMPL